MRFAVVFLIVILSFQVQLFAQERDTLVVKLNSSMVQPKPNDLQLPPGEPFTPVLFQDYKGSFNLQNSVLQNMNFNLMNGWKINTGSFMNLRSVSGFPFTKNQTGLYRRSIWEIYQGTYGIRTYQLNNNLFVGTAGYTGKSINVYSHQPGIYPQTNYSSSLFVGYKFSDKFSISAGFTIQRNGDPLNRNQGMQNGGMFP